jgi:RNA 2',3'-cyclic 3'-phosphodiesterase
VNVHLTLAFLGEVPEESAPAAAAALAEAARASPGPLALHLAAAGAFPSPRRARVLWLGVGGDLAGLAALQAALARALAARALPGGEARFSPHLTIGRSRSPHGAAGLEPALATPVAPEPWLATEAVLFESELRPSGAIHRPLERHRLGPP